MSDSSTIAVAKSVGAYFEAVVDQALRDQRIAASREAQVYLVELLAAFAKPEEGAGSALSEPVTFLLRDAMEATGFDRFKRLQNLGDGVLYGVGFFGEALSPSDRRYFVHVGASAFSHASQMLGGREPSVLGELSQRFDAFVEVLADVADWVVAQSAQGQTGIVRLYERWLRRSSGVLTAELAERGIIAPRKLRGAA